MQTRRVPVWLLSLALLTACTSADVRLPRPQAPQAGNATSSAPPAAARSLPATGQRPPLPAPRTEAARVTPVEPVVPKAPVPVTTCDPGGCWGPDNRYQGGTGNIYLDRNGRMCQGNGTWMQCF
ncbi:MAG TPA: hypothetical protein VGE12_09810 [Noviherbaspirillum sp.]